MRIRLAFIEDCLRDARYALRGLRRNPGFTLVAVLTLAICIGANVAMFSMIRAVLLRPPQYRDPDRLVLLTETRPETPGYSGAISAPNYLDWKEQNTVFESMAAVTGGTATLSGVTADPVYVRGRTVSASYFDVFGMRAALGRTFAPDEDRPARNRVVLLSDRLWQSTFGSDPNVVGRAVRLDGDAYIVIGVMPPGSAVDLLDPELWMPRDLGREGGALTASGPTVRNRRDLNTAVARLKPGVTLEQARRQMDEIASRLARAYPESNRGWGIRVQPWPRAVGPGFETSLYLLFGAVGMVLALGCVNLANLTLARASARSREQAVRVALGARRRHLVRQSLIESLIIAMTGGAGGLLVAYGTLAAMSAVLPSTGVFKVVPAETAIAIDGGVWLFLLSISLLSAVAFGVGPALSFSAFSVARPHRRLRRILVVSEVALAFVLATTAGLLIESLFLLQQQLASGVDATNVLTATVPMRPFTDSTRLNTHVDRIGSAIQSLPGVREVAFAEGVPPEGSPFLRSFQIAGQREVDRARRPLCGFNTVTPTYFRALRLQVLLGRSLTERDRGDTSRVAVVNETFARTYFPGIQPIGQRLLMDSRSITGGDIAWEVVGVVEDEGLSPWTRAPQPLIYVTREQNASDQVMLVVRATSDVAAIQESIRKAVSAVDSNQAVADIGSLGQQMAQYVAPDRLRSQLLAAFAGMAVLLAAIGLYGVVAYLVIQRRREIAIRMALGASTADLVMLVLRDGMAMTAWGVALGVTATLLMGRVLASAIFGVQSFDLSTAVFVTVTLSLVALVACGAPARRAACVDSRALRLSEGSEK
jgi:putative ABC transport system permease protein